MKLKLLHEKAYGQERFYPNDDFTKKFLRVMKPNPRSTTFTLEQIRGLKDLGFEIEIKEKTVTI